LDIIEIKKPCLVQTTQGFSLSYQNKYLYSKYNPSKQILNKIQELTILEGTIVLCFSPCLCYGLSELIKKQAQHCLFLGCELDNELHYFTNELNEIKQLQSDNNNNFVFLSKEELLSLPSILIKSSYTFSNGYKKSNPAFFKRIIRIDFSAGTSFQSDLYNQIEDFCIRAIKTFWTNRFTLTKFGKLYSTNLFRNLKRLPETIPISSFIEKISKPIVVFGAGESSEKGIAQIKKNKNKYFIICVDTSLRPLLMNDIEPDCVFIEEAQIIIDDAFVGTKKHHFHICSSLSASFSILQNFSSLNISFFATEFLDSEFFSKLKQQDFFPFSISPFGSVGLTAVFFALKFRIDDTIPVFIYGLDFSYSKGKTHQNGSMPHISSLLKKERISSLENFYSCYNTSSIPIEKNNIFSTKILISYAELFNNYFCDKINLFSSSKFGIPLKIKYSEPFFYNGSLCSQNTSELKIKYPSNIDEQIQDYYQKEIDILKECEQLLSGQTSYSKNEIDKKIFSLLSKREYLYLFFPDGWKFSMDISFLKRVKSSIVYFLKIFEN
jgi:hypothetical protein